MYTLLTCKCRYYVTILKKKIHVNGTRKKSYIICVFNERPGQEKLLFFNQKINVYRKFIELISWFKLNNHIIREAEILSPFFKLHNCANGRTWNLRINAIKLYYGEDVNKVIYYIKCIRNTRNYSK